MPQQPALITYSPPPNLGLNVIYHDKAIVVVNKPSGLLSVPGRGEDKADCMVSRVQVEFSNARIVHRLDMETSGLLILARGAMNHRTLSMAFEQRLVSKRYVAVVYGHLNPAEGEVNLPLIVDWPNRPLQIVDHQQGRPSLTRYKVVAYDEQTNTTRVELEPVTGRTHQLRVHMLSLGHVMVGDTLYASEPARSMARRLQLHAYSLSIPHPLTKEILSFECPADF